MEIKGTTRVCGLIGNPVEHSISPLIHNTVAGMMGLDMVYVPFKVEPEGVDAAIQGAFALNVQGMNVTVPHKQAVIEHLDDIDELAQRIGAVNTLVRTDKGYKGYNTDIIGLHRELTDAGIELKDSIVVIIGAGGASRAITFLCAREGAGKIYLVNRSVDKAEALAKDVNECFGREVVVARSLEESCPNESGYIVIQTTSVGLYPDCDSAPVEDEAFYEKALAGVDIIYNPAKTKFMKFMEAAGKPAYNGLKMLLYQGIAAFELWNNVTVSRDIVDKVYTSMKEALNINE